MSEHSGSGLGHRHPPPGVSILDAIVPATLAIAIAAENALPSGEVLALHLHHLVVEITPPAAMTDVTAMTTGGIVPAAPKCVIATAI